MLTIETRRRQRMTVLDGVWIVIALIVLVFLVLSVPSAVRYWKISRM